MESHDLFRHCGGVHHLWFIPYILLAYLITPALYDYKRHFQQKSNTVCLFLSLGVLCIFVQIIEIAYSSYFAAARVNGFIVGFFLPDIIERLSAKSKRYWLAGITAASMVLNYMYLTVKYELLPTYPNGIMNTLCNNFINYGMDVFALAIFCLLLVFTKKVQWIEGARRFLDLSDKYSYDVYIVHMIYIKGVLSVLDLTESYFLNVCLMLVLTIISAIVLRWISRNLKIGRAYVK